MMANWKDIMAFKNNVKGDSKFTFSNQVPFDLQYHSNMIEVAHFGRNLKMES